jgi:two-component system phosphate regulon sensor histidine kinase PhoR
MILNADTLQNAYMDETEMKTSVAYIQRQCQWLERLTQKLLKLITLKGQLRREDTALLPLFERVRESMAETLEQRGTPVCIECDTESLELDADLMQSVIVNLIDNASKASKQGQSVRLAAHGDTIEVSDRGCGIPADELERITEPFYMVDKSRSKQYGGSGLGLALVKEIVTAHGASLYIESELGIGTTVIIRFNSSKR